MNTTDFLNIATAICPDKTAIVYEDKRYTFSQLNERVNRLANGLMKLGVKKGDRVSFIQVNCNQCVETYFAVAKMGAIYLPLNFRAKEKEFTYMLNTAEATTLIVGDRYVPMMKSIQPEVKSLKNLISIEKKYDDMLYYEDIIDSSSADEVFTEIDEKDTTILMYTAGTTGFPKGVMLSHNSFSSYMLENVSPANPDSDESNILTVPLYHVAGIQAMMAAIYGGRTLVMERQFEPEEWMTLVETEKANRAMMVPTMLKQLLDHPNFKKHDLSSLRVITYGAAPMPLPVIRKALEEFPGVSFINAFGQTETASTITALGPEDHVLTGTEEEKEKKLARLASIGKPMADVEMKVVDDDGKKLGPNEVGEILAKGPRVMSGYWKDEEKTAKTIDKDGWVHTGDVGYVDEEGYYFLSGRSSDMIIRAGENISPEEIENVIRENPKVEDVAVIGVPDETWGEEPRAVVIPKKGEKPTEEEIMEWCRKGLASFKRPRSVVFVDDLPRNPMGKLIKKDIREKYGKP
ncbi:MAG: long-chain-fatty-acid--CoA ligase [Dehalococcoidales bacterium]|nr:long-chain-fatty-acid--CoA ligase [Dehalococcoidales bacterium]